MKDVDDADYHKNKGHALFKQGKFAEAIEEYDVAIKLNPNNPEYHSRKGVNLARLKRFDEALKEFDVAIKLDPKDPDYHRNRGNALDSLVKEYNVAIKLDPDNPTYHNNKGEALHNLGKFAEALKEFNVAIHLDPNNPDYHYNKGTDLVQLERFEEALKEDDVAIHLSPNNPDYHYNKGCSLGRLKRFEEAGMEFDVAIQLNPNKPHYHNNKGSTLKMLGKFEESLKEYDAAIKLDPSNPRYHSNKGDALDKLGKSIAAIKEHDLTIQLGKEQGRVEEPLTAPGNDERCMLCNTKLEEIGAEIRGIRFEKPSGGTAVFCANCYACSVCGTKRSKIHHILLDVSDLMLCETHLNALESYDGKSWEEFPDEFLNAMTNRLTYIRSIWETRANEILKSGSKPSKPSMWSAVGQLVNVLANNYDAANWWQLGDMKGDLDKNARMKNEYQYHRDFLASLDARIARVKEVIKDRKQLKVLQQLHPNSSERSSNDPIAVLKLRFAKGEIDKSEYEEKLKILLES